MKDSRSRAVRAIANHTRKRARVVIDAENSNNYGVACTNIYADIQVVGEDNQWQSCNRYNFCTYGANIGKYDAYNITAVVHRIFKIMIDMTLEGYIFSDGIIYTEKAKYLKLMDY
jgi:hypothetical protein